MKSFDTKQPRSSASIGRAQWALSIAPHGEANTKGGRSLFVDLCYDDFPMLRITPAANGALLMQPTWVEWIELKTYIWS